MAAETLATKPELYGPLVRVQHSGYCCAGRTRAICALVRPAEDAPTQPKNELCELDWTKCADNAEIVRNYKGWLDVQVACRIAAIETAKYGTPTWPFVPFQGFSEGKTYVASGEVVAIEPEAKFPNATGAMVRSRVTCTYDLRTRRVVNVVTSEKLRFASRSQGRYYVSSDFHQHDQRTSLPLTPAWRTDIARK